MSPRLLVALTLLSPGLAEAAGFYIADVGARGLARGGAFVAAPAGPLALHYNPAGLSLARGLHFELSGTLVDFSGQFTRRCPCVDRGVFEGPEEEALAIDDALEARFRPARTRQPLAIPFIGVSYGFEPAGLAVGFAVYGPTSGRHDYGSLGSPASPSFIERAAQSANRYSAISAPNLEINYVLGASAEPVTGLRLGFGLVLHQTGAGQSLHLFADTAFADGHEDPNWDVPVTVDFLSDPALGWTAGLSWDVPFVPGLTVGGSFRAQRSVVSDGKARIELGGRVREIGSVQGDDVEVRLEVAPIARAGVQYRRPGLFTAEAAFVHEGWGVTERIVVEPRGISFEVAGLEPVLLGDIVAERFWRDTWSLRIGGELEVFEPWLGVQAGYFYEPSAIPEERLDAARIDLDKHGFGLGVSTTWYGVTLLATAMYVHLEATEVDNSRARMTAPIEFEPELRTIVGNGRYEASYFIAALGLSFSLDRFFEAT